MPELDRQGALQGIPQHIFLAGAVPAFGQTLTCSTSFQGYNVCHDGHGYRSTEWGWHGMRLGDDNQGNAWMSTRQDGRETITIIRRAGR